MKLTLRFNTAIGPRVGVLDVSDEVTARAILNAHLADGNDGALVEEMPRISLKDHLAKHVKAKTKAALKLVPRADNVTPIRKKKG